MFGLQPLSDMAALDSNHCWHWHCWEGHIPEQFEKCLFLLANRNLSIYSDNSNTERFFVSNKYFHLVAIHLPLKLTFPSESTQCKIQKNKQTKSSLRALGLHHFPLKVVLMKYIPSAYADFDQKWYRCLNMRFRLHCRSTWRHPGHLSGAGWWDMQGTHLPEVQLQLGGGHTEASGIIKSQNHYRIGLTQVVSLNLCRATRFHAIKHPICYCY